MPPVASTTARASTAPTPSSAALAEHVQGDAAGPAVGVAQQVQHQRVLDQPDPRVAADRGVQRPLHLGAGGVAAGVHDPVGAVAALAGQHQRAVRVAVERGAPAGSAPGPGPGPPSTSTSTAAGSHSPTPATIGVAGVRRRGVERVEHGGDAALRPPGRAVVDVDLGDHGDVQARLAQVQRARSGRRRRSRPRPRRWSRPSRARARPAARGSAGRSTVGSSIRPVNPNRPRPGRRGRASAGDPSGARRVAPTVGRGHFVRTGRPAGPAPFSEAVTVRSLSHR